MPMLPLAALLLVPSSDAVKVCQVGYLPSEPKFAMLTADAQGSAVVRRVSDGRAVMTLAVGPAKADPDSGDNVRSIDFSALKEPGVYRIEVGGVGSSFPFRVGDSIFAHPFRLAMRAFTGQRCGIEVSLAPDFPQFHHDACHTAPSLFHSSSGKTGTRDELGGWHDAGDFGKYVVNSGITTGTLLWAYELNEKRLRGIDLDLPESGGPLPDVLAEIKWNLDWMLKMQDEDGGVWHKETTAQFPGMIMPEADKGDTLIIGSANPPHKVTTATGDFAAVCAIAARVYRPFDAAYADRCRVAAERAWSWLQANRDNPFRNPPGIGTGGYGDGDASDERLWAAAELFRTTGRRDLNEYFLKSFGKWKTTVSPDNAQSWGDVHHLAMWTYSMSRGADRSAVAKIRTDSVAAADAIAQRTAANPYRTPLRTRDYVWGSNAVTANYAMMLQIANRFRPSPAYRFAALDALHYLLGRNTFDTSYVTWVGSRWPMHPHHRPSEGDGVEQPWPGMIVGGPNASSFRSLPPARAWKDEMPSFSTNEIAINWNAPLVFVLADLLPSERRK